MIAVAMRCPCGMHAVITITGGDAANRGKTADNKIVCYSLTGSGRILAQTGGSK